MRSLILFLLTLLLLLLFPAPADPGAAGQDPGRTAPPPAGVPAGEELEDFIPSEEIGAGSAISFPVDI